MNKFRKFLTYTADQIASTSFIAFIIYAAVKGIISLFTERFSTWWLAGIVAIGFTLGIIQYVNWTAEENENVEDPEDFGDLD